jgi:flagellar capping protein FliD
MTYIRSTLSISSALSAALLLSSCGKQEAVGDVPSSEELAKQADAATKAIQDQEAAAAGAENAPLVDSAEMTSYANALRGFSIMVPRDWVADDSASDDDGRVFNDAASKATLTAGWIENREDADLTAAVKALEDAGEGMTGNYVNENEYRASGIIAEGSKTAQRILRKPDGTMIKAAITYPADSAETVDPLAQQILDSLTLQ